MPKMVDLEKLSALETEIELLEKRKLSLESGLEILTKDCNTFKDKTDKEIAKKIQQCDSECQEKINEANNLLKEAEKKLKTAEQREKDSETIEKQVEELSKKQKDFSDIQKETEALRASCLEKEHKAELLIEQYNKKIAELEEVNKKK